MNKLEEINNSEYKEIEFYVGDTLEECINQLLKYNKVEMKVYGSFNGHIFYSDKVTMDSAYLEIHGKTKEEWDNERKQWRINEKKRQEEFKKSISNKIKHYKEISKGLIKESKLEEWYKIIPVRLNDLYEGYDLNCTLNIAKVLNKENNPETFEEVNELLKNQGHSGLSYSLVIGMIKDFCNNGEEFYKWLEDKENKGE